MANGKRQQNNIEKFDTCWHFGPAQRDSQFSVVLRFVVVVPPPRSFVCLPSQSISRNCMNARRNKAPARTHARSTNKPIEFSFHFSSFARSSSSSIQNIIYSGSLELFTGTRINFPCICFVFLVRLCSSVKQKENTLAWRHFHNLLVFFIFTTSFFVIAAAVVVIVVCYFFLLSLSLACSLSRSYALCLDAFCWVAFRNHNYFRNKCLLTRGLVFRFSFFFVLSLSLRWWAQRVRFSQHNSDRAAAEFQ